MTHSKTKSERSNSGLLAPDFRNQPYWWDAAKPELSEQTSELPASAEVVIIGAGITGTMAALKLARGGADVLVLDRQAIGEGAARRNAGYIGRTLKRSLGWLEEHAGAGRGLAIYRELNEALHFAGQVVAEERIACHHQICGRFIAANSAAHLKLLLEDLEDVKRRLGFPYEPLAKADMAREMASEVYAGGAVIQDLGSIHPGLYHLGLVERAKAAGVRFMPQVEVLGFESSEAEKRVATNKGSIKARHLIVTTNGYTTGKLSWHARRVVPFRGFILATEMLPAGLIDRVLPNRRTYLDTKLSIDFIRPAPDSERILFGGMTGCGAMSVMEILPALLQRLTTILPDLKDVRISRAWDGLCAGTFDFLPHIGRHDGMHYALGYNFAGVPIGSLFGAKLAARILGQGDGQSAFDIGKVPSAFFYRGNPWFVPLAMRHYARQDRKLAGRDGKLI